jgi:hypothetical protein
MSSKHCVLPLPSIAINDVEGNCRYNSSALPSPFVSFSSRISPGLCVSERLLAANSDGNHTLQYSWRLLLTRLALGPQPKEPYQRWSEAFVLIQSISRYEYFCIACYLLIDVSSRPSLRSLAFLSKSTARKLNSKAPSQSTCHQAAPKFSFAGTKRSKAESGTELPPCAIARALAASGRRSRSMSTQCAP